MWEDRWIPCYSTVYDCTVLRVLHSYLYVGASLGSGSLVSSVCAVMGIGVLWAPGAGGGARLVVYGGPAGAYWVSAVWGVVVSLPESTLLVGVGAVGLRLLRWCL